MSHACSRSSRTCAGLGSMPFASPETASQSTCMRCNDPRLNRCVIVAPSGCRAPTGERTEVSESTQSSDCEEARTNIHRSPREVAKIIRFGGDATDDARRGVQLRSAMADTDALFRFFKCQAFHAADVDTAEYIYAALLNI